MKKLADAIERELDMAVEDEKAALQAKLRGLLDQMERAKSRKDVLRLLDQATKTIAKTSETLEKAKSAKGRLKSFRT